jgi:predicted Rdx family selenoprotein
MIYIVLTQDIIFDYIKTGKSSPVLNLNYCTGSNWIKSNAYNCRELDSSHQIEREKVLGSLAKNR